MPDDYYNKQDILRSVHRYASNDACKYTLTQIPDGIICKAYFVDDDELFAEENGLCWKLLEQSNCQDKSCMCRCMCCTSMPFPMTDDMLARYLRWSVHASILDNIWKSSNNVCANYLYSKINPIKLDIYASRINVVCKVDSSHSVVRLNSDIVDTCNTGDCLCLQCMRCVYRSNYHPVSDE